MDEAGVRDGWGMRMETWEEGKKEKQAVCMEDFLSCFDLCPSVFVLVPLDSGARWTLWSAGSGLTEPPNKILDLKVTYERGTCSLAFANLHQTPGQGRRIARLAQTNSHPPPW